MKPIVPEVWNLFVVALGITFIRLFNDSEFRRDIVNESSDCAVQYNIDDQRARKMETCCFYGRRVHKTAAL